MVGESIDLYTDDAFGKLTKGINEIIYLEHTFFGSMKSLI
jgi:hypothetical protein